MIQRALREVRGHFSEHEKGKTDILRSYQRQWEVEKQNSYSPREMEVTTSLTSAGAPGLEEIKITTEDI